MKQSGPEDGKNKKSRPQCAGKARRKMKIGHSTEQVASSSFILQTQVGYHPKGGERVGILFNQGKPASCHSCPISQAVVTYNVAVSLKQVDSSQAGLSTMYTCTKIPQFQPGVVIRSTRKPRRPEIQLVARLALVRLEGKHQHPAPSILARRPWRHRRLTLVHCCAGVFRYYYRPFPCRHSMMSVLTWLSLVFDIWCIKFGIITRCLEAINAHFIIVSVCSLVGQQSGNHPHSSTNRPVLGFAPESSVTHHQCFLQSNRSSQSHLQCMPRTLIIIYRRTGDLPKCNPAMHATLKCRLGQQIKNTLKYTNPYNATYPTVFFFLHLVSS